MERRTLASVTLPVASILASRTTSPSTRANTARVGYTGRTRATSLGDRKTLPTRTRTGSPARGPAEGTGGGGGTAALCVDVVCAPGLNVKETEKLTGGRTGRAYCQWRRTATTSRTNASAALLSMSSVGAGIAAVVSIGSGPLRISATQPHSSIVTASTTVAMAPRARPSGGYDGATDCVRRGIGFRGVIGFAFCSSGPIVSRRSCAASTRVTAHTPRRPQRSARRNDKLPAWLF